MCPLAELRIPGHWSAASHPFLLQDHYLTLPPHYPHSPCLIILAILLLLNHLSTYLVAMASRLCRLPLLLSHHPLLLLSHHPHPHPFLHSAVPVRPALLFSLFGFSGHDPTLPPPRSLMLSLCFCPMNKHCTLMNYRPLIHLLHPPLPLPRLSSSLHPALLFHLPPPLFLVLMRHFLVPPFLDSATSQMLLISEGTRRCSILWLCSAVFLG